MDLLYQIRNQIKLTDIIYYGCTSGSTGDPKICTYTNKQFVGNIMEINGENLSKLPYDKTVLLNFVPFFTATGYTTLGTMFLQGFQQILTDSFNPKKNISNKWKRKSIIPGPVYHFEVRIVNEESREIVDIGFPGD